MEIEELWNTFAKSGMVADYLEYKNAVNVRCDDVADRDGRTDFTGTQNIRK